MNSKNLKNIGQKPKLYEPGDANMQTDDFISKQLLELHLNPGIDAATRKPRSVENTLEFILQFCHKSNMQILDLGCGPGNYTEKLAKKEHPITGVDFSENSVRYAKQQAEEEKLNIEYICQNYLELNFDRKFDLILLIYTDFGVLIPEERDKLLSLIYTRPKPGGIFIFDVLNDWNVKQKYQDHRTWQIEDGGFWRNYSYLELINGIHYHNVNKLTPILTEKGFINIKTFEQVLPESDVWNGENVTFYTTNKPIMI